MSHGLIKNLDQKIESREKRLIKYIKYILSIFLSMNNIKKIYKDIEMFNMDWAKQRAIMHIHPRFVEQFYYMYDINLVGSGSDGRENLELYSNLI